MLMSDNGQQAYVWHDAMAETPQQAEAQWDRQQAWQQLEQAAKQQETQANGGAS